jgi:hypothetical protein
MAVFQADWLDLNLRVAYSGHYHPFQSERYCEATSRS